MILDFRSWISDLFLNFTKSFNLFAIPKAFDFQTFDFMTILFLL